MSEAKRNKCGVRFDIIPAECLIEVAKVLAEGAEKYGEFNWQKSRMTGENGPMNHAMKHLINYQAGIPDEDGPDLKIHLTHAIVNLMFEFWYVDNMDEKKSLCDCPDGSCKDCFQTSNQRETKYCGHDNCMTTISILNTYCPEHHFNNEDTPVADLINKITDGM